VATRTRYRGYTRPDGRDPARIVDSVAVPLDEIDGDMNAIAVPGAASAATVRRLGRSSGEALPGDTGAGIVSAWQLVTPLSGVLDANSPSSASYVVGNGGSVFNRDTGSFSNAAPPFFYPKAKMLGEPLADYPAGYRGVEYIGVLHMASYSAGSPASIPIRFSICRFNSLDAEVPSTRIGSYTKVLADNTGRSLQVYRVATMFTEIGPMNITGGDQEMYFAQVEVGFTSGGVVHASGRQLFLSGGLYCRYTA